MSAYIEINLDLQKLDQSRVVKTEKGTYYRALVKVVDDYNYGKNAYVITSYDKDNKPEREHKIGNGRVVWTSDGTIQVAQREEEAQASAPQAADFPF